MRQIRFPLVLLCFAAGAQTPPPAPADPQAVAAKTAPEIATHDAPATFKSKVNLVVVPTVVLDNKGHAIGNLTKEDFQLFDKGKPQIISRFTVEKAGAKVKPEAGPGATPPEKAAEGAPPDLPDRYTAYLFDDVHLKFEDLVYARDAAAKHLNTLQPTERAAIYTTSGQTMLDFTDDRAKLHEALSKLRPRSIRANSMDCPNVTFYVADLIVNKNDQQALNATALDAAACGNLTLPRDMGIALQMAQAGANRMMSQGENETRMALGVLKNVVRRISIMPGQRSIVLVSPGFLIPFGDRSDETQVMDNAIRFNVIISALDARGLYVVVPGGDASQQSSSIASANLQGQYQLASASADADVLAELAHGTGGTFFQNSNDLVEGFKRVASPPEYVYLLGFSPENLKLDGSLHNLKVTLKNGRGLTVQARRSYTAPKHMDDPKEEIKQEIESALFSREEMHDFPVELHTQFFKTTDDDAKLSILARLDVRQLHFRKADGRNRDELKVVAGLFDRNGNYLEARESMVEMRLLDATLETKLRSGITVKSTFDVKPGSYIIRLVVRDAEGQMMAATNGAVEIP
jgi:VWFA-related protein